MENQNHHIPNELKEERSTKLVMWNDSMDECLCNLLMKQVYERNLVDNKFTPAAWKHVVAEFNRQKRTNLTRGNFKNRLKTLRKTYLAYSKLESLRGASWDPASQCIKMTDNVWAEFVKKNPNMARFKDKPCPIYESLRIIVGKDLATGKSVLTGEDEFEAPMDADPVGDQTQGSSGGRSPLASDGEEPIWSPIYNLNQGVDDFQESILVVNPISSRPTTVPGACFPSMASTSKPNKKGKTKKPTEGEAMAQSIEKIVNVLEMLRSDIHRIMSSKYKQPNITEDMVKRICNLVPQVPGILDDCIYPTINYLVNDDRQASIFLGLSPSFRENWFKDNLARIITFNTQQRSNNPPTL